MAAFLIVLLTSLLALTTLPAAESRLYTNYYQKSCPRFAQIVQDTVTNKQIMNPTTAAATLRLRHSPPLLPRLPRQRLRRLHPPILHPLQQGDGEARRVRDSDRKAGRD
ncbi:hypothetical protein ACFX19_045637 [Malus domestica]